MPESLYRVTDSFWTVDENGNSMLVQAGSRVREGHPMMKGREDLFTQEDVVDFEWDGPAPETRRGPGRPRKNPVG